MKQAFVKVVVSVGVPIDKPYEVVQDLKDYSEENRLRWGVSRFGAEKVKVTSKHYASDLDSGAIQAVSMTVQEVELALATHGHQTFELPASAEAIWYLPEETDDEGEGDE